jgi:xanthine dehydrogenase YagT iron-sulfur-binding subunit
MGLVMQEEREFPDAPVQSNTPSSIGRRSFLQAGAGSLVAAITLDIDTVQAEVEPAAKAAEYEKIPSTSFATVNLQVNGQFHKLELDPRTTVLDALRDHLHLTGTKKGCDHGQCGACTVMVNGSRINACLSLAVMHDGDEITTIEGVAHGESLHEMQEAFLKHDGFQCGYCTPGQICSAIAMLAEVKRGMPSYVTHYLQHTFELTDAEIKERMSGNICRCAAYPNIVAAIRDTAGINK